MLLVKYGIRIVRGERKAQIPLLIKYSKKKKCLQHPRRPVREDTPGWSSVSMNTRYAVTWKGWELDPSIQRVGIQKHQAVKARQTPFCARM